MTSLRATSLTGAAVVVVSTIGWLGLPASAEASAPHTAHRSAAGTSSVVGRSALGRQVLPSGDGWASSDGGTTGGAAAAPSDVHIVSTRAELVAALGGAPTGASAIPRIIYVKGSIDGNVDAADRPLSCDDYAAGTGYSLAGYLAAYDPAVWGRTSEPTGALEDARAAAAARQKARIVLPVGSNTTIVGLGADAELSGVNLMVAGADNVIVRNLTLRNAYDCFPQWDPTDTAVGNWNSDYDLLTIAASTHVWVDHDTFTDVPYTDDQLPTYFDRPFQQHDGTSDIIRGSDLVTVSWNRYEDHDKTMLVGNSNSSTTDPGRLRLTVHHNLFKDVLERAPRLRFGHADVYDNWYVQSAATAADYVYSLGVGVRSHLWAEQNAFTLPAAISPGSIVKNWGGTVVHTTGNLVNGTAVDLLAAHNADHPTQPLADDTTWTPLLRAGRVDPAARVPMLVGAGAGAGRAASARAAGADDAVPAATSVLRVDPAAPPTATSFTTVQAALDAVPAGDVSPVTVLIAPGRYREVLRLEADRPHVTLRGATGNPRDVVISYDNANGTLRPDGTPYGTTGSATATVLAHDTTLTDLTIENAFDEAAHPEITNRQAVALKTQADRIVLDRVRLLGHQDTFYVNAAAGTTARVYVVDSFIAGDVDFVFGSATAVLDRTVLRALTDRAITPAGFVTAASTPPDRRGLLVDHGWLLSDAASGSTFLGRPWHPGGDPTTVPEVVVRDTVLPAAIGSPAWTDMSGFSWTTARFAEHANRGPGAATVADPGRPQLTTAGAAAARPRPWLAGTDGWDPIAS